MKNLFKFSNQDFDQVIRDWSDNNGLEDPRVISRNILPSLEVELEEKRKAIAKKAERDAEDTANRSCPKRVGDNLGNYLKYIAAEFSEHCNLVHAKLQTSGLERYKNQVILFGEKQSGKLQKEYSKMENKVRNTERQVRDLKERDVYNWLMYPFLLGFVTIMLFVDMVYNTSAFQAMGFNFTKSAIIAFGVVSCLALFGYLFFEELRKDMTMKRSTWKIWGIGSLILACFVGVGYLRVYYMNEMGEQSISVAVGTMVFMVINTLIFGGTSIVFHRFFPTQQQRKIRKDLNEAKKLLKEEKSQLKKIENDRKMLRSWVDRSVRETDDLMDYANDLLKQNLAAYDKVTANWIREVSTRLPYVPDCMQQDVPEVKCEFVDRKEGNDETETLSLNS